MEKKQNTARICVCGQLLVNDAASNRKDFEQLVPGCGAMATSETAFGEFGESQMVQVSSTADVIGCEPGRSSKGRRCT